MNLPYFPFHRKIAREFGGLFAAEASAVLANRRQPAAGPVRRMVPAQAGEIYDPALRHVSIAPSAGPGGASSSAASGSDCR